MPHNREIVGSRWIFKVKEHEAGEIVKFKARIVAQNYNQMYEIDYDQLYAPIVSRSTSSRY